MRPIEREDVPVAIQDDNVELRLAEVGEMTVAFVFSPTEEFQAVIRHLQGGS